MIATKHWGNQDPHKYLRWRPLQQYLTAFSFAIIVIIIVVIIITIVIIIIIKIIIIIQIHKVIKKF